ncbi:hypothetical protein [Microbacterium sp. A94]|uniref:hypothetical protein n=1 Tax=Microbacterium sp. A94 TaxID=3450717 RepID=UPI003F41FF58
MKIEAGKHLVWRGTQYEVVVVSAHSVTLRDENRVELDVAFDDVVADGESSLGSALRGPSVTELGANAAREVSAWSDSMQRIETKLEQGDPFRDILSEEAQMLTLVLGRSVSTRTVERQISEYRRNGEMGLADYRASDLRSVRVMSVDPRVVDTINRVLTNRARASTTSKAVMLEQVTRLVEREHGTDVKMPSRATFYRILDREDRGRFSFGSAKTRESLALQPDREFRRRTPLRPGEQVQIDSTRLDVMVRIDDSTIGRPELSILLDVATRSILAAVLRPEGTKSVDLVVVLARALVPYARRPEGARETRRLISTAWVDDALVDQERFERLRLAQPYIFPETITTDRGRNYLSRHFSEACERLGISLIAAAPHTPTDKPHVERTFESIASLFLQYAKGYVGRSVEHRGRDVESQSEELLTIAQMQELLEDWIAVEWQNRSHDGLRDPLHPRIALSPNEMCKAFRHVAPELHVPLTRDDFIALLPVIHRRINRYGVTIDHRVYDSKRLAELRRRQSPQKSKRGRWAIRVDPYNLHVVWLDVDGEFIPLSWANDVHEMPMLGDVWRYARDEYRNRPSADSAERNELSRAMRGFAAAGNPKRAMRHRARAKAVAADPMNMTSATAIEDTPDAPVNEIGDEAPMEDWPNRGGFELIGEPMQEIRWRLEE